MIGSGIVGCGRCGGSTVVGGARCSHCDGRGVLMRIERPLTIMELADLRERARREALPETDDAAG